MTPLSALLCFLATLVGSYIGTLVGSYLGNKLYDYFNPFK